MNLFQRVLLGVGTAITLAAIAVMSDAGMHDDYMDAARKFREAARYESDSVLREGYLEQAREMERNARALESDVPVFGGGDKIQEELNRQLNNIQSQSRPYGNSSRSTCGGRVCATSPR